MVWDYNGMFTIYQLVQDFATIHNRKGALAAIPMIFFSFFRGFGMVIALENHLFVFVGIIDGNVYLSFNIYIYQHIYMYNYIDR